MKNLGITGDFLDKYKPKPEKKVRNSIHTELHELVAVLRKDFDEKAEKGKGSFSFYLGLLKKVPVPTIYMWHAEIKQSPNLATPLARCKVFWWKYSQFKKKSTVIPLSPKA